MQADGTQGRYCWMVMVIQVDDVIACKALGHHKHRLAWKHRCLETYRLHGLNDVPVDDPAMSALINSQLHTGKDATSASQKTAWLAPPTPHMPSQPSQGRQSLGALGSFLTLHSPATGWPASRTTGIPVVSSPQAAAGHPNPVQGRRAAMQLQLCS